MTNVLRRVFSGAVLAILSTTVSSEQLAAIVETVIPSVAGIGAAYPARTPTGGKPVRRLVGTGFAVEHASRSYIVTNAHVVPDDLDVEGGEHLVVFVGRGASAQQRSAWLERSDLLHDLALLSYDGAPLPPLNIGSERRARSGDRVAFTGFPLGAALGLFPATHEGIVATVAPVARVVDTDRQLSAVQLRRMRNPFDVYQLDAIAYPGNSGSAVYRSDTGEVVGIMNSVFVKESRENLLSRPSGIAYAIPVEHLKALLGDL